MERGQIGEFLNRGNDVLIDQHRAGELFAPMDHAVPHGADLGKVVEDSDLSPDQRIEHQVDCLIDIRSAHITRIGLAAEDMREFRRFLPDSLDGSPGQNFRLGHLVQIVFDGGATCD